MISWLCRRPLSFALGISGTALSQATDYINITDFWVGLIGAGSLMQTTILNKKGVEK